MCPPWGVGDAAFVRRSDRPGSFCGDSLCGTVDQKFTLASLEGLELQQRAWFPTDLNQV